MDRPSSTTDAVVVIISADDDDDTVITVEVHDLDTHVKVVHVFVVGELDMRNASALWQHARAAFNDPDATGVIIDLSAAFFLDSLTISALLNISKDASRRNKQLAIVVEQGCLADRILGLARVTDLLPVRSTQAEALATIRVTRTSVS